MSNCKSCGARISWAKTDAGKNIPLDEVPNPRGNLVRTDLKGGVRVAKEDDPPELVRWISHFATCPNAASHRRSK